MRQEATFVVNTNVCVTETIYQTAGTEYQRGHNVSIVLDLVFPNTELLVNGVCFTDRFQWVLSVTLTYTDRETDKHTRGSDRCPSSQPVSVLVAVTGQASAARG